MILNFALCVFVVHAVLLWSFTRIPTAPLRIRRGLCFRGLERENGMIKLSPGIIYTEILWRRQWYCQMQGGMKIHSRMYGEEVKAVFGCTEKTCV